MPEPTHSRDYSSKGSTRASCDLAPLPLGCTSYRCLPTTTLHACKPVTTAALSTHDTPLPLHFAPTWVPPCCTMYLRIPLTSSCTVQPRLTFRFLCFCTTLPLGWRQEAMARGERGNLETVAAVAAGAIRNSGGRGQLNPSGQHVAHELPAGQPCYRFCLTLF